MLSFTNPQGARLRSPSLASHDVCIPLSPSNSISPGRIPLILGHGVLLEFFALFLVLSVVYYFLFFICFSTFYLMHIQSMEGCIIVQILEAVFAFGIDNKGGVQQRGSGLYHTSAGGKN